VGLHVHLVGLHVHLVTKSDAIFVHIHLPNMMDAGLCFFYVCMKVIY